MAQLTPLMTVDKRTLLAQRFQECIHTFPFTDIGERQIQSYRTERVVAQTQYAAIVAAHQQGDDITDTVLDHLLPHANTAANRSKAVWVTHSTAMPQDIRAWYTRTGWAKVTDWPDVSHAILHFIHRCLADPTDLTAACHDFTALPYTKGLQMGMLTPILNALRPDTFLLMNRAALRVLNFFTATTFTMRLADYPAVNRHGHQLLDEIADLFRYPLTPTLDNADLFDLFAHWLVVVKRADLTGVRAWKVTAAAIDADWQSCLQNGYMGLPAAAIGDMAQMSHDEFMTQVTALQPADFPDHADLKQWWTFAHTIQEDDAIIVNHGTRAVVAVGRVTGPYYYVTAAALAHRLPMEWITQQPLAVNHPSWRKTISRIDRQTYEAVLHQLPPTSDPVAEVDDSIYVAALDNRVAALREAASNYTTTPPLPPPTELAQTGIVPIYTYDPHESAEVRIARVVAETTIDADQLLQWRRLIDRKGQGIISGPPGTGKSYVAERLAQLLADGLGSFVEMIQFHPAYAYEDFIQGIRPQTNEAGNITYPLVAGRFLQFCRYAQRQTGRCVLIIDEINRANLAQVFGEALYLLEYRDRPIALAGGGAMLIPVNVRIIGTMNTADRSIALIDYALRRRFAFITLQPDYDLLRRYHATTGFPIVPLIHLLERINREIGDAHYQLGISYFLRPDLANHLADIWQTEIEPYLDEYFLDQPERTETMRWQQIRHTLLPSSAK